MEIEEALSRLNFSKNEIKIYLTLLKIGKSKVSKIAKEAMMDRSSTYSTLDSLYKKGICSYVIEENKKYFIPSDPKRIIDYIEEKKEIAKRILPKLKGIYNKPKESNEINTYKGYKGIRVIFQKILEEGKTNYFFGSEGQFSERMPYYAPHFIKELEKKKIKIKSIIRAKRRKKSSKTTEVRYFPSSVESNVATNIFGDYIGIIIWSDIPEGILIKNKIAAETYKKYFEFMWKHAKKERQK